MYLIHVHVHIVTGKDYSLVHAAPIISVFILDRDGQLLPSPNEVEHHAIPG